MYFARAVLLTIFTTLVAFAHCAPTPAHAEYWSHPFIGECRLSGLTCARMVQIAAYGTDLDFGPCYYIRSSVGGLLALAKCEGRTHGGATRPGYASLRCETGEVKSTNGCIKAPIPDKDPRCDTLAGNPVDA